MGLNELAGIFSDPLFGSVYVQTFSECVLSVFSLLCSRFILLLCFSFFVEFLLFYSDTWISPWRTNKVGMHRNATENYTWIYAVHHILSFTFILIVHSKGYIFWQTKKNKYIIVLTLVVHIEMYAVTHMLGMSYVLERSSACILTISSCYGSGWPSYLSQLHIWAEFCIVKPWV